MSARSEAALAATAAGVAAFLDGEPLVSLDDVATTLVHGREPFEQRLAVVAGEPRATAQALRDPASSPASRRGRAPSVVPRTVFAFTGQGTQYTGMAAGAYAAYPEFRNWLDRADALLQGELPAALLDCLFRPALAETLARTDVAAAAIVAVQLGLVRVLERYGIAPDTVLGHSVGEFSAAVVAGAAGAEEALLLVARRGVLMVERTKPGAMLSVRCQPAGTGGWDAAAVTALAAQTPEVSVAALNSPRDLVLSGDADAIGLIGSRLDEAGLRPRRLQVSHAFHCDRLVPMAEDFAEEAGSVTWSAPSQAQWISCARGPMTEPPDARFWRDHLTEPVRFWDALTLACPDDRPSVLVEIGPHPVLLPLAAQLPAPPAPVPVLHRDHDAAVTVAAAAAEAWCHGAPVDLTRGVPARRIHLPGYGFDRRVHSPRLLPLPPALAPLASASSPAPERAGLARPAREELAEIWSDLLGGTPDTDTAFFECGGDSLILLRLQQRIQDRFGAAPGLDDLLDAGTFGAMVSLLPPSATVGASAPAPAGRPPAAGAVSYRPSATQQSMLFTDLMQPDSNQHNVTLAMEISGRVDATAMADAFRDAQVRHAALRTVFLRDGGDFRAEIHPTPGARLTVVDARAAGVRPLDDDRDVREWARELSDPPVRCLGAIPLRGVLVCGPVRSLLVITAHHAVSDATSVGLMVEEVAADYHRYRAGMPGQGPPAPVQFHELHAGSRQTARAREETDRAYWRDQLAGAQDLVPLPTDRPRPEVRQGAGAQWSWHLDRELTASARELATELNTTLFATMLAAYAVLLRLRSGASDLSIATPVTGRTTAESARVFGPLLNTLVLRVTITPGQVFDRLVRDVQATVLEGIRHSAFPFIKLVTELNPQRDPGRTPLFSVMFAMPPQFDMPDFDGQRSRPVEMPGLGAKFDLTLYVTPAAEGALRLDLEYDPALFDESTARDIAADHDALLAALLADPRAIVPEPGSASWRQVPAESEEQVAVEAVDTGLSEMERYVARLWSETLEEEISGPDDDFFEAGGHSMLVLACLAEVQDRYPDATIQDFFSHRTVRTFAARLETLAGETDGAGETAAPADTVSTDPAPESTGDGLSEMERYVARLWSETLEEEISGPDDDFFEAGGHSMLVLACLAEVQDRYPDATIQDFFSHRTVRTFAARLETLAGETDGETTVVVDTATPAAPAPAAVDRGLATERQPPERPAQRAASVQGDVLLTGATGFLGAHLLAALLRKPESAVVCLVRPRDGVTAIERLQGTLGRYAPDVVPQLRDRVTVIEADLSELGSGPLDPSADGVGTIVHSAAEARMFGRIEDFRAANVAPTRHLAGLARERGWHLAHVSTATAVGAAPGDGPAITLSEDDFDRGENFDNPYSRSKFEAERVVRAAIADGLDATVHRVGGLVGDTATGTFLPDPRGNLLYQMLRAIMRCGLVPDRRGFTLNLTPVDFAAAAVLRLAGTASCSGRTFHVRNPAELTMPALSTILRDLGYPAVLAEPDRVARWLGRDDADDAEKDAAPFLGQFTKAPATVVAYDTSATTAALAGLACPAPDATLLRTIIGYGVGTGYFPASRLWDFVTQR